MIICVCKNVSTNTIQELIQNHKQLSEIISELSIGTTCGKCLDCFHELYNHDLKSSEDCTKNYK